VMKMLVIVSCMVLGCSSDEPTPPDADTTCEDSCSVVDSDPLTLPANRCPNGDESLCVTECNERMPHGNYCPPP
jgi:hypothetical protein